MCAYGRNRNRSRGVVLFQVGYPYMRIYRFGVRYSRVVLGAECQPRRIRAKRKMLVTVSMDIGFIAGSVVDIP
jgi:hypothetical protein